jgi:hypothetical protein
MVSLQVATTPETDLRVADGVVMRSWCGCTRPSTSEVGSRHIMAERACTRRKSMYTSKLLLFTSNEFHITFLNEDDVLVQMDLSFLINMVLCS